MRIDSRMPRTLLAAGFLGAVACGPAGAALPPELESPEAQQSYSLGVVVGQQAIDGLGELDSSAFLSGVEDALSGTDTALTSEQIAQALTDFDAARRAEAEARFAELAEANRAVGESYRQEFAKGEDVVTLESGLQYRILEQGEGEIPAPDATVTVHYRGMLVDGQEFDSSYSGEPVSFPVDRVIPGWTEALTRMPAGSKWQVVIPPELAYGERGAGPIIGPDSTLVFEMELIAAS